MSGNNIGSVEMKTWRNKIFQNLDLIVIIFMMIISNFHLVGIGSIYSVLYSPGAVVSGEFFRLLTFPFAHVSWYHFLLDASAFLFLYSALRADGKGVQMFYVVMCIGMSLIFSIIFAPQIKELGLCGLSGAAHGLFFILSLEMMHDKNDRIAGIICAVCIITKCVVEVGSGGSVFHFVHGDMIGVPVLESHVGGVVGGFISFIIVNRCYVKWVSATVVALFLVLSGGSDVSYASGRTALVIGNSLYDTIALKNPENDARDMAGALKACGFEVELQTNTDRRGMESAIRDFGKKLKKGGVGLFFYAGHAVQIKGANYLIPVDSRIQAESDIIYEAVNAGRVLGGMRSAGNPLNIVILDACRDNPFKTQSRSTSSLDRGLARMAAPKGTLIAYSTSPGRVAADGDGRNSPYTGLLLSYMKQLNTPVETVFKNVRRAIDKQTEGRQIPWEATSLTGDFYFKQAVSHRADAFIELAASLPDTVSGEIISSSNGPDLSRQGDVVLNSGKSYLGIHVVNNTGYEIPSFSVRGRGIDVSKKIEADLESNRSVYSGHVEAGRYDLAVKAQYAFTEDDLESDVPAVPVASRSFFENVSFTIAPGERTDLRVIIGFQNSGFWETRNKEALVITFSESRSGQLIERRY